MSVARSSAPPVGFRGRLARAAGRPADQASAYITGACIALEMLGKPRVQASPVVEGTGWIQCAHGRLPIPAPATLAILGDRVRMRDLTGDPGVFIRSMASRGSRAAR